MKTTVKAKATRVAKRDLFAELREGMAALAEARQGKRTLRTHAIEYRPAPKVTPKELIRVREGLKISRALFAENPGQCHIPAQIFERLGLREKLH